MTITAHSTQSQQGSSRYASTAPETLLLDNVRNLHNGHRLWTTTDYMNTFSLREEVLGWKTNIIELDYQPGTTHIIMTADLDPQLEVFGIERVMRDNASNYSFNNQTQETAAEYVQQNNTEIVAIASIGFQNFPDPQDLKGFMRARVISRSVSVARFYAVAVNPAHQHKGLELRVMNEALFWCRQQGVELLWANARESALRFYTNSLNFREVGDWFLDGNTEMMDKRIVRWLT